MAKDLNSFGGANIVSSPSNCKLSNIESARSLWAACMYDTEEEKVQRFKNFFAKCSTVISLNTIIPELKDFLVKNFKVHSVVEVPVGYNNNDQYYIIINNNKGYWREVAKKEVTTQKAPDMKKIEETLTKVLKAKRRKTDIVKDVMASING